MHKDIETLINKGYRVVEKNIQNTHYHVFFGTTFINLWANAQKYMPQKSQPATEYNDIQEVIDYMEGKTKVADNFRTEQSELINRLRGERIV